jgi:large subunit ribosomal protein L23
MHYRDVIRRPIITEKTNELADEEFQYVFEVDSRANKHQIKEAVELIWPKVDVQKVRVMNMPAKRARRWRKMIIRKKGWKKAVVTLAPGQRLEIFEGV